MSQPWNPPPPSYTAPTTAPNNNLVLAIIATVISVLFCCVPHGVVSLIFALQVNKKAEAGDTQGALNAAKQAKMWAFISIVLAVLGLIIGMIFGVLNTFLTYSRG
jgi:hypothetical protein